MYTVFLARFVAENPEFQGFPVNFSTSKKVSAFQSCLRKIGARPLLVVTHAGDVISRRASVKKIRDSICIIPPSITFLRNRKLQYLFGILFSYLIVFKLRKLRKINLFIAWDFLPDTFLPLLLQGPEVLGRTIVDVEEAISKDPRAGSFFRAFENFIVRNLRLRIIGNNESTARTLGLKLEGLFPGFFAISLSEERQLMSRIEKKSFSHETVILFSGRIDTVRGATEFVKLARHLQYEKKIKFIMTGYGNEKELVEIQRLSPPNISFRLSLARSEYLDLLYCADIAFNYLSDSKFAANSFPSKVVEYLLGAVVIVSNHALDLRSKRIIVRNELSDIATFVLDYHSDRERWRSQYHPKSILQELSPYSISSGAEALQKIIHEE